MVECHLHAICMALTQVDPFKRIELASLIDNEQMETAPAFNGGH